VKHLRHTERFSMTILPGVDILLLARPPTPQDVQAITLLVGLLGLRLLGGPLLYLAARKSTGNEMWYGALALVSPLLSFIAFVLAKRPRPSTQQLPWNPWILCPYCGAPRGYSISPCPRCAMFLPVFPGAWPPPPPPPPPPPEPAPRRKEVLAPQVLGTLLFGYGLAVVALLLLLVPIVPFYDEVASSEILNDLTVAPWFVLVQALLLDLTLFGLLVDQTLFQKRLTRTEMGLTLHAGRGLARNVGIGIAAGVLTFAFSSLFGQALIDFLKALGFSQGQGPAVGQPVIASLSDYAFWIVAAVVVAPLGEELFFRGYALAGLARKGPPNTALLFSSVLFAAVHLNPIGFIPFFFAGIVLGTLFLRTGSLATSIVAHATNNLIVTTLVFLGY